MTNNEALASLAKQLADQESQIEALELQIEAMDLQITKLQDLLRGTSSRMISSLYKDKVDDAIRQFDNRKGKHHD